MIKGQVNALYEAVVPVRLQDARGAIHEFEAVLDTGFNGTLTLPPDLITTLQLEKQFPNAVSDAHRVQLLIETLQA